MQADQAQCNECCKMTDEEPAFQRTPLRNNGHQPRYEHVPNAGGSAQDSYGCAGLAREIYPGQGKGDRIESRGAQAGHQAESKNCGAARGEQKE